MKYDLRKLAQMVSVARAGSFSRAAEELHITQPALSRNIAALERELGITVFERGRRGATLTPVGALAVEATEALLRQADSLEHNLELFSQGDAGHLAFGLGPMLGSMVLPGLGREFLSRRPALRLRAVIKPARELLQELLQDRIELFYCGREQLPSSPLISVQSMARMPIAHVVRRDHPLAGRARVKSADLRAYPFLAGVELPTDITSGELVCDNYHILRETALHSDSVWITSPRMIEAELAAGSLCRLNLVDRTGVTDTDICQVSRVGFRLSPAAERVRAYMLQFLLEDGDLT